MIRRAIMDASCRRAPMTDTRCEAEAPGAELQTAGAPMSKILGPTAV
jgi:hypothetical protein